MASSSLHCHRFTGTCVYFVGLSGLVFICKEPWQRGRCQACYFQGGYCNRLTKNLEFYFPKYLAVPQLKYIILKLLAKEKQQEGRKMAKCNILLTYLHHIYGISTKISTKICLTLRKKSYQGFVCTILLPGLVIFLVCICRR